MVYLSRPYPFKFLEAVFHKFFLVHPWILGLIFSFFYQRAINGTFWTSYYTEVFTNKRLERGGIDIEFFKVKFLDNNCRDLKLRYAYLSPSTCSVIIPVFDSTFILYLFILIL